MSISKVIKSISDKRAYRPLVLANNIECLVISDKDAQKSAAALSVGVGSLQDPLQAQGLAHYLEHMLFMGTGKYPEENEYNNFLNKNSGSSNAYTSLEQTNFYFEVGHGAFDGALDRFSRFFIDPLMLDSSSERELNAVHSEHSKNLQNDAWRKYHLTKHLARPGHPYNKFSTGNKTSLSNPNLREMLFNFYNSHYSANLMKLVVYGQSDLDSLTKSVEQKFAEVKNHNYQRFQMKEPPYHEKTLKKLIKLVPVKDKRTLELNWIISNQMDYYKYSPSRYVSHLLGHEGKNSLLSFLIAQGLATGLSAGGTDSFNCYSQFQVTVTLSDKGLTKINQITGYVLYYIQMLKKQKPQKWVVDQIKKVNKMKFDYMQKSQGMNYCSRLAKFIHKRKMEELLIYPYFMEEFKPELINTYLDEIKTDNLVAILESKTLEAECTQVQPIYTSKYCILPLVELKPLPCAVGLPDHNTFIPQDLNVLPLGTNKHPKKLYQSEFMEAFFKEDHQFELPKAQLDLRIYFNGQNSVRETIVSTLFSKMLRESLREFTYMAEQAELDSEFSFSAYYYMGIKVVGFRDSFDKFTLEYLQKILEFIPKDQQLFQTLKEKQKKQYANFFLNVPYQLAYNSITRALRDGGSVDPIEKVKHIDSITLEDLAIFARQWSNQVYMQFYMTGNLPENQAKSIAQQIENFTKKRSTSLSKAQIGAIRPIFLPLNKVCAVEEELSSTEETNNSLIIHYQHEQYNLKSKILQELAHSFIKEPAFDYLRTKQQLGYIVMCLSDDHRGVIGESILVQSNIKSTYELVKYVQIFVNKILKEELDKLTEETFQEFKNSLQNTKSQKDKTLGSEANRFWEEVVKHSYVFERKEKQIEAIPQITLDQFKKFVNHIFYDNPRIFEIHQIAKASKEASQKLRAERVATDSKFQLFPDVETFRKKMPLYPDYYSHL